MVFRVASGLLFTGLIFAAPKPASIFGDHMILQRDKPIPVWGMADAGEKIFVSLGSNWTSVKTGLDGKWLLRLPKSKAGGPFQLKVSGRSDTVVFQDVHVGEVWLASGQSNMQMRVHLPGDTVNQVRDWEQEVTHANFPMIRTINIPYAPADLPSMGFQASWQICSPQSVGDFSGVGYFFARELHRNLKVPIGIINASVGASCMQCWMTRPFLSREYSGGLGTYDSLVKGFDHNPQESNPHQDQRIASTICYNGLIHPLIPYSMRGVIWYQGETLGWGPETYRNLQLGLVKDWRAAWKQGDFPFLITQLANLGPQNSDPGALTPWALQREAQSQAVSQGKNMAMAVTIDIGESDNIHPRNKQDVGLRLSLAARALAYGHKIPYRGPVFQKKRIEADSIRLFFNNVAGKLMIKGAALDGFSVSGSDGKFFWAEAQLSHGNTVVVRNPKVKNPRHVRYGMADNPVISLYDSAALPAPPFRTDSF